MLYLDPQWQKVIRDLWDNKARTLLVVLAIAVGIFAFGSMFATRTILLDNLREGFKATNQATLDVHLQPFDESLTRTVEHFPNVIGVEARTTTFVQIWNGSSWVPLQLFAVPHLDAMTINRIQLEQGTLTLSRHQIVLERASFPLVKGAVLGGEVPIQLADNKQHKLQIAGVAHDFSSVPASRVPQYTGYVSLDTLREWGLKQQYDELLIVTNPVLITHAQLEGASNQLQDRLEKVGHEAASVDITEPGKHWASDFISGLVLILAVLGTMSLGLSGFLVVNTITAMLSQQKRQIGMMKAIGGVTGDILSIYMTMCAAFGVLSLLIALPIGAALSYMVAHVLADFMNFDIYSFDFPWWVILLQVVIAIIAPLAAAFIPILAGTRTTVREAISDYGIANVRRNRFNEVLFNIRGLPRPLMLSLRNTFRRTGRLILTLVTLTIAGAIFISILNTRNALLGEFDKFESLFGYDIQISLARPQNAERIVREGMRVSGVARVEGWGAANGSVVRPPGVVVHVASLPNEEARNRQRNNSAFSSTMPGRQEKDKGTAITILAPPIDTAFITPDLAEGRWFQPGDEDVVVLSTEILRTEPYLKVGDQMKVDFGDKKRDLKIIGVVNVIGIPLAYAPFDYVTRLNGTAGLSPIVMIGATSRDPAVQQTVAQKVEDHYRDVGIGVSQTATIATLLGNVISQIDFLILLMLGMAAMLGLVGGLGLASTMSLNVLERTREIGVMRSLGASNSSVRSIFLTEGILIGLISGVLASALSVPISFALSQALGSAFFQRPMGLVLKPDGFVLWLSIALIIAAVASLLPANRATQISVRESIAYE